MSEVYLARTNQKLNFVRLHLDALQAAQNSNTWSKHALIESYQESILFHLVSAYSSLLREIAERYQVDVDSVTTIDDLERGFEKSGFESPELNQLLNLEADPDNWLHKLQKAYAACWRAVDKEKPSNAASQSEIQVMQVNPNHQGDKDVFIEYQQWLGEMRTLVEKLREGMQEW
ncbi:MAG: hypothetical protein LRY63_03015 [Nitrincola sp.]|nr:hypothetical protein [Nitrincola sp.]